MKKLAHMIILFGITGMTGCNGGYGSLINNPSATDITSISSYITHGEAVTINGMFSEKLTVAPVIWDDFEEGGSGEVIGNGWTQFRPDSGYPIYTNNEKYTGEASMMNVVDARIAGTQFATAWKEFTASEEVYSSYLYKFVITGNGGGFMKLGRITSDSPEGTQHYNGQGDTNLQYQYTPSNNGGWLYTQFNNGAESPQWTLQSDPKPGSNEWFRVEVYKKLSSVGNADGIYAVSIDNKLALYKTGIVTRDDSYSFQLNSFLLPLMYANPTDTRAISMYVDDVYVDTTLARIEIGNCPVFEECSKREIQIPQSWASDSISFKVNLGAFVPEDSLYVFVIDSEGDASDGLPVSQL